MISMTAVLRHCAYAAFVLLSASLLSACDDEHQSLGGSSLASISNETMALMQQKGVDSASPVLIRTYKQEAELEVWKKKPDGQFIHLKTFPMCRWSGQLGPKLHEGDRQVPEGFYTITPGQLNPNSHYYLSFNVGYPNAYDRTHGASGGDIMVHGICSSAGCFSMTNEQISEIYALAREAFNGGQRAIQMQSFPFKMTAENLAKHRLDPNIAFWKMLKQGADNFEVTKQEPEVGVCNKHYVFNARGADGAHLDPYGPCPALAQDRQLAADVAAKEASDDEAVAKLVSNGVKPVKYVYEDGGMNAVFYNKVADVSRPEGLVAGPTIVALDNHGRPLPLPVLSTAPSPAPGHFDRSQGTMIASAAPVKGNGRPLLNRWFGLSSGEPATEVAINEPAVPEAADVPLPPRRPSSLKRVPHEQSIVQAVASSAMPLPTLASAEAPQPDGVVREAVKAPFYERWLGLASGTDDSAKDNVKPAPEPAQAADAPLPPRKPTAHRVAAADDKKAHAAHARHADPKPKTVAELTDQ